MSSRFGSIEDQLVGELPEADVTTDRVVRVPAAPAKPKRSVSTKGRKAVTPSSSETPRVYAVLSDAHAQRLRELADSTHTAQAVILGRAIDALTAEDLDPYLPQSAGTTMPGATGGAVKLRGANYSFRVSPDQARWITDKHQTNAPDLAIRQYLGVALAVYLTNLK